MRQVFTSPRLENAERVAQLLRDAGIEVKLQHGRSYKGALRGDFSYRDQARTEPQPAVWVVQSEDQPKARALLRAHGLLDSTRSDTGYRLPAFRSEEPAERDDPGRKRAFRLKLGLLLVIAIVIGLAFFSQLRTGTHSPAPVARVAPALPEGVSATPDALAVAVLAGELPERADEAVCLSVDGHDPSPALLASLPAAPGPVIPLSQCPAADVPRLSITDYRVRPGAGNGAGSISLARTPEAGATPTVETYEVNLAPKGWRVVELL
ncbi:MAG TPA: hypothetical protein VFT52_04600 [Luteimonas sp.]|jgi:hypothetical protein|nr:hypothetical protein [Luteimonas sp.]